ncbi:hypothetical protein MASR2M64_16690 [Candidatus Cloacimonadota bacterium]
MCVLSNTILATPNFQQQTNVSSSGKHFLLHHAHSMPNNHRTLLLSPCASAADLFPYQPLTLKNKLSFALNNDIGKKAEP